MDYLRNSARGAGAVLARSAVRASLHLWLWGGLSVFAAEAPAPLSNGDTTPPLITIRQFFDSASERSETNFLRLQGVVTASLADKTYFLQDGDAGVYVFHRPVTALRMGEWVEVTGHPSLSNLKPLLDGLAVRHLGMRALPPPVTVTFQEAMSGRHHMRLIRIRGRLAGERPRGGRNLVLSAGGSTNSFLADLEALPNDEVVARIQPGSLLELTGVCNLRADATRTRPVSLTVFARSAVDVVVISGPPWWTRDRMLALAGISLAALGLALLWGLTLRLQVRGQTADLRTRLQELQSSQERFATIFRNSPDAILIERTADERIIEINPTFEQLAGFTAAEAVGRTTAELGLWMNPADRTTMISRLKAGGSVVNAEVRLRSRSGAAFDALSSAEIIDYAGERCMMSFTRDITTRKESDLESQHALETLQLFIDSVPGYISFVDAGLRYQVVNPSYEQWFDRKRSEIVGRRLDELHAPAVFEEMRPLMERALAGDVVHYERCVPSHAGQAHWFDVRYIPRKAADGTVAGFFALAFDITAQKDTELALRESEEKHRSLVERMGEGLLMVNNGDVIQFANRRTCDMFGYTHEEMLGRVASDLINRPEDQEQMRERNRERQSGFAETYEIQLRRKSGEFIWCHNTATPVYGKDGVVIGSMAIMADITARKQAEEALHETMENLRTLIARSPVAMITLDGNARVQLWNPAAEKMFGWSEAEVLNQPLPFASPDGQAAFGALGAQEMPDDARPPLEQPRIRKDGTLVVVNLWTAPLRDAQGRITGTLGMLVDITARRRAEDELRKLSGWLLRVEDEERRRIARELHDSTAQNLAALAMSLSVLRQAIPSPDTRAAGLLAECKRLVERSVQEIRTISYLLHPPLLDEFGLAWAVCDYADGFAKRSKIRVDLDVPENFERLPHPVELALFRVLQEGLGNVHRHSGSATASIRLARQADTVTLEVRDAGRGLDPAALGGSTLGVGITGMRERLRQLGGRVEIESGLPGTRLRAILPLEQRGT